MVLRDLIGSNSEVNERLNTLDKVYRNLHKDAIFELFISPFSSKDACSILAPTLQISSVQIGATSYKKYGWATEKEFPIWTTIQELASFLSSEKDIGLIHLELEIKDFGMISIKEDRQCEFKLSNKNHLFQLFQSAVHPTHQNNLLAALLNHPDLYITIGENNEIKRYHTLEEINDRETL